MLVSFWQEAEEEEEDIVGPITIADCHLLSIPTWSTPLMMYTSHECMFVKQHVFVCHVAHHVAMLALESALRCLLLGYIPDARATKHCALCDPHTMPLIHPL